MVEAVFPFLVLLGSGHAGVSGMRVEGLRTEYLRNPMGVEAVRPRLSWYAESKERGARQSAYEVLVADSPEALAEGKGNLWDSGKVASDRFVAEYAGKRLQSGTRCYWKARVWDGFGKAGPWSESGFWGVGLLDRSDWKAKWISSPVLADPANRPRTPIRCYRSELARKAASAKWIIIDLGSEKTIDQVTLTPGRPNGLNFDLRSAPFPVRFRIDCSDSTSFEALETVVDQTHSDYPEPRVNTCDFHFPARKARLVRLYVSRLGHWDGQDFGFFLGQFSALSGGVNVSVGAAVTASDSVETEQWSKKFLTTGASEVEFAPFPSALDPKVPGAFSSSRTAMLRREFHLPASVRRATLYSTARGFYDARINGKSVSPDLLAPGFTDFNKRISYQSYDVTSLLHQGDNSIGALLGYGWYAGHMNLAENGYFYGYFPQFGAQLEVEMTNGASLVIPTDERWQTTIDGAVRWSDLLDGEACDFRREEAGWDRPGFAGRGWLGAWSEPFGSEELVCEKTPPVREIRLMRPVKRTEVGPERWVFDLGQEITGWVRLKADGPAGTQVTLKHAEAVHPNGEIDVSSLWGTKQRDDYILGGTGPRVLEPHFTYHGFRYFEVAGVKSKAELDSVVGVNIHSAVAEIGDFECSNPLYNRLMTASKWTQRNLFFDVPAGCAARSERLAWTGDIRPCVQTAMFNFDTAAFFEKYAADLRDDQKADGRFTDIAPHAHLTGTDLCVGSPGWGDAGVSLPWDVYVNTGDPTVLAAHYSAAKRWVDFVHLHNPDYRWKNERGMDWGDWLSAGQATPKEIGATAFFAHSADLVARMARVLGRDDDATAYGSLFQSIRKAFQASYVLPDGQIRLAGRGADVKLRLAQLAARGDETVVVGNDALGGDPAPSARKRLTITGRINGVPFAETYSEGATAAIAVSGKVLEIDSAIYGEANEDVQGSYALALHFGLLDEPVRSKAVNRLLEVIRRDGGHPTTGFWSSTELQLALSDAGHSSVASEMVNLKTRPSWGYMVESGGTTFWEAYDADEKTLSLNHWTHSACGEWLWRNVAGLQPDDSGPGFARFTVRPFPSPEVSTCRATYRSVRGPIGIWWGVAAGQFEMKLHVPVGSLATVYVPGNLMKVPMGARLMRKENGSSVLEVESGAYDFLSNGFGG